MNKITIAGLITLGCGAIVARQFSRYLRKPTFLELIKEIEEKVLKTSKNSEKWLVPFEILKEYTKNEQGYEFRLKVVTSLVHRPLTFNSDGKDPFEPPYQPGQFVMNVGPNHVLLLNKFPVERGHVLVVPKEFVHQSSPMRKSDLLITFQTLKALSGFAFFNSHKECGASQPHKHIQVLPRGAMQSAGIVQHIEDYIITHSLNDRAMVKLKPFKKIKHFIIAYPFINEENAEELLYECYIRLMNEFTTSSQQIEQLTHNLIITSTYMMIVIRKIDKFQDITINGVGFAGSFLVKNEQQFEILKNENLMNVLESLCEQDSSTYEGLWI